MLEKVAKKAKVSNKSQKENFQKFKVANKGPFEKGCYTCQCLDNDVMHTYAKFD